MSKYITILLALLMFGLFLGGCARGNPTVETSPTAAAVTGAAAVTASPSETPSPTPTPEPLVARVNQGSIGLVQYQAELARYQAAAGHEPSPEEKTMLLDGLIDQLLLAQAAQEQNYQIDEAALQARESSLAEQLGGQEALQAWMDANHYSPATFRSELGTSIGAAWMRDEIAAETPQTSEQVHALQILVDTPEKANQLLAQLQEGQDFATLAAQVDPITGGELGWFPRGYLSNQALEDAAFSLNPKEYSSVIQSEIGYHIIYVVVKDPARLLDADMRLVLGEAAIKEWLSQRRSQSQIEILATG